MTAELVQTLAEHGISSTMTTDEALVYRLLDSVAADGGLTPDAKKEVRGNKWGGAVRICNRCWRADGSSRRTCSWGKATCVAQIGLIDLMQLLVAKHYEIAQDVRAENLSNSI